MHFEQFFGIGLPQDAHGLASSAPTPLSLLLLALAFARSVASAMRSCALIARQATTIQNIITAMPVSITSNAHILPNASCMLINVSSSA
jgi:hypothetical protein